MCQIHGVAKPIKSGWTALPVPAEFSVAVSALAVLVWR